MELDPKKAKVWNGKEWEGVTLTATRKGEKTWDNFSWFMFGFCTSIFINMVLFN